MTNNAMTSAELKQAIKEDIEALKTIDIDIMPSDEYYRTNARLFLYVLFKLFGTALLGLVLPLVWYWHYFSSLSEWLETLGALFWASLEGVRKVGSFGWLIKEL